MRKRLFGVAMALCVLFALISPGASAASGFYAILYEDGELVFQRGSVPRRAETVWKTYSVDLAASYAYNFSAPWHEAANDIRAVTFANALSPLSTAAWFYECANLKRVDKIDNLDTSRVMDMFGMFCGCASLTALDLSGFDTSNVADMAGMFQGCASLTALDVSSFDTSAVEDMFAMFADCASLTALDLSGFDASGVEDMRGMFENCASLRTLDLSGFDTSSVADMSGMFNRCASLTALDVSSFDTSNVEGIVTLLEFGRNISGNPQTSGRYRLSVILFSSRPTI